MGDIVLSAAERNDTMAETIPGGAAVRLDARLKAVFDRVRPGAFLADIGTDHAYLPIALCQAGRIRGAVACDIRRGPLERARAHVAACALTDQIVCRLGDGLAPAEDSGFTDAAICGMGGEVIAGILSRSAAIHTPGVRLILQPMTHAAEVRRWLMENGFSLFDEGLARADGRLYQIFCAERGKTVPPYSPAELEIGRQKAENPLLPDLLEARIRSLTGAKAGRAAGGKSDPAADALLAQFIQMRDALPSPGKAESPQIISQEQTGENR